MVYRILTFIIGIFLLLGCGKKGDPKVAVALPSEAYLVRELAADDFNIVIVLPEGLIPEKIRPTQRAIDKVRDCDLLIYADTPGFEHQLSDSVARNVFDITRADISRVINTLPHPSKGAPLRDPNIMFSLRNCRLIASQMKTRLSRRYPNYTAYLKKRALRLDTTLKILDDSISAVLAPHYGESFVSVRPTMGYFARDYGLRQIYPLKAPSAMTKEEYRTWIEEVRAASPRALFYDNPRDSIFTAKVGKELGLKPVRLNINSSDFLSSLKRAADAIHN
ncbi:MAG: zinc ABC transporter substrate-binding protein [Clostridium sp.]|nr:zinc ABC transporter substrate-binding protein [Prevotella sp.]MCM1429362.1 zinc ABC transporter substrate-binding protein [Clostridium sp.]MCM1475603.1 zinc ABC transporter substrate-binding protein [Muribaculaceae bacterium]